MEKEKVIRAGDPEDERWKNPPGLVVEEPLPEKAPAAVVELDEDLPIRAVSPKDLPDEPLEAPIQTC